MTSKFAILALVGLSAVNGLGFTDSAPGWRVVLAVAVAAPAFYSGRRLAARRDGAVLAAATVATASLAAFAEWRAATATLCVVMFVVLPWLIGRARRQQARLVDSERARADQLERQQELVAERARLAERARIAADMHDSLGHSLALIALRAGSLELAAGLSAEHRLAAERLRGDAVSATDELRHTIALLRSPGQAAATHPPDEDVAALVERAVTAGMVVNLRYDGTAAGGSAPADDTDKPGNPRHDGNSTTDRPAPTNDTATANEPANQRPASTETAARPPLIDRAVYRVVQEALTNAARYAPASRIEVVIEYAADVTAVRVTNSAPGDVPLSLTGTGQGLAGLRERVELLNGSFAAAKHEDGFRVAARLPHSGAKPT